jgi:hypothetical protein
MQKVKDHRKAGAEDTTLEKKIEKGNVKGIGGQYRNYQKRRWEGAWMKEKTRLIQRSRSTRSTLVKKLA